MSKSEVFVLLCLFVLSFSFAASMTSSATSFPGFPVLENGNNTAKIYFVMLEEVGSFHGYNLSRLWEGVLDAARNRTAEIYLDLAPDALFDFLTAIVKVNATVSVVQDWNTYKAIVEYGDNIMIINAHDQYLPVPEGYTKEQWVDKIADAMLNRYVIWAHVVGYPFFNVYYQNDSTEEWGVSGLQRLMSHIDEYGITSWQYPYNKATVATGYWIGDRNQSPMIAYITECDIRNTYPLNLSQFSRPENLKHPSMYSYGQYIPGAILRFRKDTTSDFGLYLHLTATLFYNNDDKVLCDRDFARGYAVTAWALQLQFCWSRKRIYDAEKQIRIEQKVGNTSGLEEAQHLLQEAQVAYAQGNFLKSLACAEQAETVAKKATPPPLSTSLYAFIFGTLGIGAGTFVYVALRRNGKNGKKDSVKHPFPTTD